MPRVRETDDAVSRRPRLADVARLAGVSIGAASKAMSAPGAVRPRTLAAVQAAVEQLGYIPSDAGRALASRSSRMVGVVMPTLYHPVYATFFHTLQNTLAEQDYLTAALSHDFDREKEIILIERLVRRGVDALILIGTDHDDRTIELLEKMRLPHLFSWSSDEAPPKGAIGFSNQTAMRQLVEHLAGLGHRRVAMINGDIQHNERARWRLKGVRDATDEHGMELVRVATVPLTITGGLEGYREIDPVSNRITALVCSTDLVAAGALHGARQDGVVVPDDMSITGFDDIEIAELLTPALTTVRIPVRELATRTGHAIVAMLRGEHVPPSHVLSTRLIARESSGPARVDPHATVTSLVSR